MSYHIYDEKEHWTPEYSKKRENKVKQAKSSESAHVVIKSSRNWEVGKILITICNGHKIRQVDIISIINTIHGVLLNYIVTSYMFLKWYLFSLYYPLINDEYITVGRHYYVPIVDIGSVTLTMILPNSTSKLTFTDILHIFILKADLISFGVLHHKDASVWSWKKDLIILKNDDDLFSTILDSLTSILY